MIAADMDAAEVLAETAGAVDAGAPAATAREVAIADAADRDVMAAKYQLPSPLRIALTSRPNSKDLRNPLSQFCCPANRCQY